MSNVADGADKNKSKCTAPKQARTSQAGVRPIEGCGRSEFVASECGVHERGVGEDA